MLELSLPDEPWNAEADLWFDRPDALAHIDALVEGRRIDAVVAARLRRWVTDGYFVIEGAADSRLTDELARDLDAVWSTPTPIEELRFEELRADADSPPGLSHRALLELPADRRAALQQMPWRIHSFEESYSQAAAGLVRWVRTLPELACLLGDQATVMNTITFMFGSRQPLHQDWAVAHIFPRGGLLGVWIALEDVGADAGPLVYYPGSHRLPPFSGFTSYPLVSLKTCDAPTTRAYADWVERNTSHRERRSFIARRGDVMIWHSGLIHGGADILRAGSTRRSFVCHLTAPGCNKARFVTLPPNW